MDSTNMAFDPEAFLKAQQTEVNEKRELFPTENPASPDGLYIGIIGEVKSSTGTIGKGDKTGEPWMSVVIPIKFDVPAELQQTKQLPPQFQFTDRVFLDLTPGGKGIDNSKGKNRGQKAYRDALKMNVPGEPFSWSATTGRPIKFRLVHELYEGNIVEKIAGVFPV